MIRKDEFLQFLVKIRPLRKNCFFKQGWLRVGIAVKRGGGEKVVAWPEATTTNLMRIGFSCNDVRKMRDPSGMHWSTPTGEAGDFKIHCSPKEMHGANLADKVRAKLFH